MLIIDKVISNCHYIEYDINIQFLISTDRYSVPMKFAVKHSPHYN